MFYEHILKKSTVFLNVNTIKLTFLGMKIFVVKNVDL